MRCRLALMLVIAALLEGCISMHSYVDPQYHHAAFSDLARSPLPYALSVQVEFERNEVARPGVDRTLLDDVDRTLRASGVVVPYDGKGSADGAIRITLDNVADMGASAAKGFGTGLTFGLVGSQVADGYEMSARLTQGDSVTERKYHHVIYTTVGNASGPPGVQAVPLGTAFNQVIDDMLLNFIKDVQAEGRLTPRESLTK